MKPYIKTISRYLWPILPVSAVGLGCVGRSEQSVWRAKLIGLGKLEQENSGNWDLPAELEPHAVMPYYWGCKGEPGLKGDTRFTSICLVPVIRARSGQPGSYFAKNSTMFLRPILYPRFPIWVIITAGGKNQNSLPGKSWLRLAFVSGNINPDKVYFSVYPKGDTVASVSPLIMPIIWPEQDLWPGENLWKMHLSKTAGILPFLFWPEPRCRFLPE